MKRILPASLLLLHLLMALDAARRLSPAWDEIVYPSAGLATLRTRTAGPVPEHPFLGRVLLAMPLVPLRPSLPDPAAAGDAFRSGFRFTYHNRVPSSLLVFLPRLVSAAFSVLTALCLWLWLRRRMGDAGGNLALAAYVLTPVFLSRASLALLEAPLFFFVVVSLACYDLWQETARARWLSGASAAAAAALLCKLTALPLLGALVGMELLFRRDRGDVFRRAASACALVGMTAAFYVLPHLAFHDPWQVLRDPFLHLWHFGSEAGFYFGGVNMRDPPVALSWVALLLKAPPAVVLLGLWGGASWARRSWGSRHTLALLAALTALFTVAPLFARSVNATIHFDPLYLGLCGAAAGLAYPWSRPGWAGRRAVCLLLFAAAADLWGAHPDALAYFSPFVGGPDKGWRWLADSDQDWGQSLPALARYWRGEGEPGLILCYSGAADPGAYGLRYQDLLSPALVSRERKEALLPVDEGRTLLAVGTKVVESEPRLMTWLVEHRRPDARPDPCFFVYDVTRDAEVFRWMGYVYWATKRPAAARAAFLRARRIDPGNVEDEDALRKLG